MPQDLSQDNLDQADITGCWFSNCLPHSLSLKTGLQHRTETLSPSFVSGQATPTKDPKALTPWKQSG